MSSDAGAGEVDLDRLLQDARNRLAATRAEAAAGMRRNAVNGARSGGRDDALPVRGVGTALEEQVRAVAAAGRLERLELDARLMRAPMRELAAPIAAAVTMAFDELRSRRATADAGAAADAGADAAPMTDPDALADRLRDVHAQGVRTMDMITQGLADAMARIRQRTFMAGDPGPQGLEPLLDQATRTVDAIRAAASTAPADAPAEAERPAPGTPGDAASPAAAAHGPQGAPGIRGTASDPSGQVHAVVAPGERIESVWIDEQAGRSGSHQLGERVVTAVNAALDDLAAKQAEQAAASMADAERLAERMREVQDLSLQQMRAYTGAMRGMMSSIEGPG